MTSTPPGPRIKISGVEDETSDLYYSVTAMQTTAQGAEKIFDVASDGTMAVKHKISNNALYKGAVAMNNADPDLVNTGVAAVSKFVENSEVIMKLLDHVKGLHPFVGVVVVAFEAALKLEVLRRKNDENVTALKTKMMDMVEVLLDLRTIREPDQRSLPDGNTLKGTITLIAEKAAQNIRDCIATCQQYMKQHLMSKFFNSFTWEQRLAAFAPIFLERQQEFSFALQIHTSRTVSNVQTMVATIDTTAAAANATASMLRLFQQLQNPKEREVQKWIEKNGGAEVILKSDKLFKELQVEMRDIDDAMPKNEKPETLMKRISEEVAEDIDKALARDRAQFDLKFNAVQAKLEEAKTAILHDTRSILDEVKGPHQGVRNPDLHAVWKEMAWRGSVKARHFINAIQEYFLQKYNSEELKMEHEFREAQIGRSRSGSPDPSRPGSPDPSTGTTAGTGQLLMVQPSIAVKAVLEKRASQRELEDRWAIEYITLARLRPIMEAFDDDASGWISIREANIFTSSRPRDYTVVKWLAFWAAGFRIYSARNAKSIENLRTQMVTMAADVLPSNRVLVDEYMANFSLDVIDWVVRDTLADFDARYEADGALMFHFHDYITTEEGRLSKELEGLGWELDSSSALQTIVGTGRIERHILSLGFLILRRHVQVIQLACRETLDKRELTEASTSIDVLAEAIFQRVITLTSHFKAQRLDVKCEFDVAYNGMFKAVYLGFNFDEDRDRGPMDWVYPDKFEDFSGEPGERTLKYSPPKVDDTDVINRSAASVHLNVFCDSCGTDIVGVRYKCLECTVSATGDGVDLCGKCKDNEAQSRFPQKHNPAAHVLLMAVRPIVSRRLGLILRRAKEKKTTSTEICTESQSDNRLGSKCLHCQKTVSRPYWSCIECDTDIFICNDCAAKQQETLQSEPGDEVPQDTQHKWHHILLQIKEIEPEPEHEELEEQLRKMEQKFMEHESATRQKIENLEVAVAGLGEKMERLSALEGLLSQVLAKMSE